MVAKCSRMHADMQLPRGHLLQKPRSSPAILGVFGIYEVQNTRLTLNSQNWYKLLHSLSRHVFSRRPMRPGECTLDGIVHGLDVQRAKCVRWFDHALSL
jgi:hypothetical protein